MPFKKRERFERSDVPTASPLRTIVSLVVLVLVVTAMTSLVSTLWRRANQVNGMGNRDLRASVRTQAGAPAPAEGYTESDHEFLTTLVLTVEGADGSVLSRAQLLSLDTTAGTGSLVTLPLDVTVSTSEASQPLSELYAASGAEACVAPLAAATGVPVSHVVVATGDLWEQVGQLQGSGLAVQLGSAADILETINTDMSTGELLELAESVRAIGVGSLARIDVAVVPIAHDDGSVTNTIDQTQLKVQLGMIVAPEPAESAEVAEEGAEA